MATTTQVLTDGYFVTNFEATSTGYYHLMLAGSDKDGTTRMVSVEQSGQGGCNLYRYEVSSDMGMNWHADTAAHFDAWLATNADMAITTMTELGFEDLAAAVQNRDSEWQDIVIMAICDAIETRKIPAPRKQR